MWLLPLFLDVACVVHIIRTGRDRMWIYAVVMLPLAGSIAYVVVEIMPSLFHSYHGQKVRSKALNKINPERTLKRHVNRLEIADTVQNRMQLAEESMRLGRYQEAANLYRESLIGVYSDDVALLMGLARATTALGLHGEALDALDQLRAAHPEFQSHEGHLIYAASLEGLGRTTEALDEYAALIDYAPGEEVRCRYALSLQRTGQMDKARTVFEEIINRARLGTRRYAKAEKQWVDTARRSLDAV